MRFWYRFENKATDPTVVDLHIFDEIGTSFWNDNAVTAKQFIADLAALPASVTTIRVHVNSPGGSVFEATAIANALRAQRLEAGRTVDVSIEGLAASAASIVIMAGTPIRMGDNALVMVHNPRALAMGEAGDLRQVADSLEKVKASIIATYQWQSTRSVEELDAMMTATTWMTADEAIAAGFATEKVAGLQATALLERDVLARLPVPTALASVVAAFVKPAPAAPPTPADPVTVVRECRAADCLELVDALLEARASLADVQAQIATAREAKATAATAAEAARQAAATRTTEITALCATAGLPELAAGYVAGGMAIADVRAHLTVLTAKLDAGEIDGRLPAAGGGAKKSPVNVIEIYAGRRA